MTGPITAPRILSLARSLIPPSLALAVILAWSLLASPVAAQLVTLQGAVEVNAGGDHACIITDAGGVRCWGANASGQLGDGSSSDRTTPSEVLGLSGPATAITLGSEFSCALLADATVACWGANYIGQLGNGSGAASSLAVAVPGLSNVSAIAAGEEHACAIAGGNVFCWGRNDHGQLGLADLDPRAMPTQVTALPGAVNALAAGTRHSCVLLTAGGMQCWGDNSSGALGNGSQDASLVPTPVVGLRCGATPEGDSGCALTAISAGAGWSCGLHSAGGVMCWGHNADAQLGDGSFTSRLNPVDVLNAGSDILGLKSGYSSSCASTTDGRLRCWGRGGQGQLGNGSLIRRTEATEVTGIVGVQNFDLGSIHACAVLADGATSCWGDNTLGQLGNGTTSSLSSPVDVAFEGRSARDIAVGITISCAVTTQGEVYCWGLADPGIEAIDTTRRLTPVLVPGLQGIQRVLAKGHACALDLAGRLSCWGFNNQGQLGDGNLDLFVTTPITAAGMESGVLDFAIGNGHTCALKQADGIAGETRVFCWGANSKGQLGVGDEDPRLVPTEVPGLTDIASISAGFRHTCGVRTNGAAVCWGENDTEVALPGGQLGDGTSINRSSPVAVNAPGVTFSRVLAGGGYTCGLTDQQRVLCWGANVQSQLGTADDVSRLLPTAVLDLDLDIVDISVAGEDVFTFAHTCATSSEGAVYCWGSNRYGQLGDGSSLLRGKPVPSGLTAGTATIAIGGNHSCALSESGVVRCWGLDQYGQIGDGGRDPSLPDLVLDLRTDNVTLASDGNLASEAAVSDASGRYIVFESDATDLVANDTNGVRDIFRRDTLSGEIERISVDDVEAQSSAPSSEPSVSANGEFIVFVAPITALEKLANEPKRQAFMRRKGNSASGVFLRNLLTGTNGSTIFVGPALPNVPFTGPRISADGSAVVFTALPDSPDVGDITKPAVFIQPFSVSGGVLTPTTGAPVCISCRQVLANGSEGAVLSDGESRAPTISADGTWVAFETQSKAIVGTTPSPCASGRDIMLRNMLTGRISRVSPAPGTSDCGTLGASNPSIDGSGTSIAFESDAALKPDDANRLSDIYVVASLGPPQRLSRDPRTSADPNGGSFKPVISGDGRVVVFSTLAKNVEGSEADNNEAEDIVAVRRDTLATQKISVSKRRDQGNAASKKPALNYNGTRIVYDSQASNLVLDPSTGLPIDSNGVQDVFQSFNSLIGDLLFYNGLE